jgi:hypothetical protein
MVRNQQRLDSELLHTGVGGSRHTVHFLMTQRNPMLPKPESKNFPLPKDKSVNEAQVLLHNSGKA